MNIPNPLTIDWLKHNHQLIHYFGLGFIQVKIDKTHRVHFYTPELPPIISREDVHNHRYDFTSRILTGTLTQELFAETDGDDFSVENESCQVDMNLPRHISRTCGLKLVSRHTYVAGSEYFIDKDTFHRVGTNNCITLLSRGEVLKNVAQVCYPMTVSRRICPFSQKIDKGRLWDIVEGMLK